MLMKNKLKIIILIIAFALLFPIIDVNAATTMNKVSCGNITNIPKKIPELTSWFMTIVQIFIPVILILLGSIDFFKGIVAQKEEEMKKTQQMFIKRLIIAAIIFFTIAIVKFIVSIVSNVTQNSSGESESNNISQCIDCFLNGTDNCNNYSSPNTTTRNGSNSNNSNTATKTTTKKTTTNKTTTNKTTTNKTTAKKTTTNKTTAKKTTTNKTTAKKTTAKKTTAKKTTAKKTTSKAASKYENIFVGDSRTVGMCGTYKLCGDSKYVAQTGMGISWFRETAVKSVNAKLNSSKKYNIIILMGVNDVGGSSETGSTAAGKYYRKIYELSISTWSGNKIIFVSVNPVVNGKSNAYMDGVDGFNTTMKSSIKTSGISNLKFCDTASRLNITLNNSRDGLHYNKSTYKKIYKIITKDCL